MPTKCHKRGWYLIENLFGMAVFRWSGRRKIYCGECSHCGRRHDLSYSELQAALRENKAS